LAGRPEFFVEKKLPKWHQNITQKFSPFRIFTTSKRTFPVKNAWPYKYLIFKKCPKLKITQLLKLASIVVTLFFINLRLSTFKLGCICAAHSEKF
jgi:hypothetical protein